MTIRTMVRAIGLVLIALVFGACGRGDDGAAAADASARRDAAEAMEATERLEGRLSAVEGVLDETLRKGDLKDLKESLGSLRQNLKASIADLRVALKDLRGELGSATSQASSALSRAEGAARDLAVLEDRFNFHLKQEHGGG